MDWHTSIQYLKGVGPARSESLAKSEIETVEDLLRHFPRRYLDRTVISQIKHLKINELATVIGKVEAVGMRQARKRRFFQAIISDGTGILTLTWFNGYQYVKKSLEMGTQIAVHGKVDFFKGFQITHPEYDKLELDENPLSTGAILPIYPLTQALKSVGLENRQFRRLMHSIFSDVDTIPDHLSEDICKKYNLISYRQALAQIHFPVTEIELNDAIRRLKFDDHIFLQLLMAIRRSRMARMETKPLTEKGSVCRSIEQNLGFELTEAQTRVLNEIHHDLSQTKVMNRLLQGDVGSGKTIVAILSAAYAVDNQVQVAVMAPTEILAYQHYKVFKEFFDQAQVASALLVGKTPAAERRKLLEGIENGGIKILIGTHALIQKDVNFHSLGFVIIDEQHRFGVAQRGTLIEKGSIPHVLAMTATPIPRTLAISYHGDLDISVIDELPKHRQPVITKTVVPERLPRVYDFMRKEAGEGKQCIIVYPLVEETEKSDLAAAEEMFSSLTESIFKGLSVGLIHGKMKKAEKDAVMQSYSANEIQILIATTVIEVGIDVPNATVMVVEHAERFGLTQLHQLRGRIGRGVEKGYCILVQRNYNDISSHRLGIMESTTDGFKISDEDLKLRGPGEFFGTRQSGFAKMKMGDLVNDGPIIREAREAALEIIKNDPHLRKNSVHELREKFLKEYKDKLDWAQIS